MVKEACGQFFIKTKTSTSMTNYVLYAHSNSGSFAELIAEKLEMPLFKAKRKKFADGEINITINESVRGRSVIYIAKIEMPYDNIIEALQFCDAARRASADEIILVVPYLIHSRQERRDDKRSPITAKLFANMIQTAGFNKIISMDIHTGAIEGFYDIPFDKLYPTEIFVEKIKDLKLANLKLVSPDAGFAKKLKYFQKELGCGMAIIDKTRSEANKVDEMILIGDVERCDVVIIDDLVDTANTLVKAADLCVEKGARSVIVFGTHGVLSYQSDFDNAEYRLQHAESIKKIYLSNTICEYTEHSNLKIKILDVTSIFANAIKKIINETVPTVAIY
jgi:ribose-phosphate pyrophosphokinase